MSEPLVFTIPAEEMPSKSVSVSFTEPSFKDRIEASRRYPNTRVGYTMEELLLAMSLVNEGSVPRDPINTLKQLGHIDGQYLLSTFLGMFTLDEDMAATAKQIGLDIKVSPDLQHTVKGELLPVDGKTFTFAKPTLGTRIDMDRSYPGADSNCGYSFEEMLFANSITSIDGEKLEPTKDPISLLSEWKHINVQFATAVFVNAVTLDKEDDKRAKSLGKSLRSRLKATQQKSTKTTTSKKEKVDTSTQA